MFNKTKKSVISIAILISVIISSTPVYADQTSGREVLCDRDWTSFISAVISYDGFTEYWKDIFVRYNKNICHYMDIDSVLKQLEKVREQIRDNFYACNTERALRLKNKYFELEAELFYVRNFIKIPGSEVVKVPDKKILEELRQNLVLDKDYFDEEELKTLFDKLKSKYSSRVSAYEKCEDPTLSALIKKWKSLKENFQSLGKDFSKSVKSNWEKSMNNPQKRTGNLLGGLAEMRLNGMDPQKTADLIYKEIVKNLPSGVEPTITALQSSIQKSEQEYKYKLQGQTLRSEYEAIYKQGGDTMAKDFEAKIKEMNEIIKGTYPTFEKIKENTEKIADKQCK